MNKNERNYWLDLLLFVVFSITITSGFLLKLVYPNTHRLLFTMMDRTVLLGFHAGSGFIGLVGVVIHVKYHWFWLKALRGKPVRTLKKPVRANRIINRLAWFAYISSILFSLLAWSLPALLPAETIKLLGHLHFASSVTCLVFLAIHLALHKKWITSAIQRYSPALSKFGLGQ